jgi:hypothetical protein
MATASRPRVRDLLRGFSVVVGHPLRSWRDVTAPENLSVIPALVKPDVDAWVARRMTTDELLKRVDAIRDVVVLGWPRPRPMDAVEPLLAALKVLRDAVAAERPVDVELQALSDAAARLGERHHRK